VCRARTAPTLRGEQAREKFKRQIPVSNSFGFCFKRDVSTIFPPRQKAAAFNAELCVRRGEEGGSVVQVDKMVLSLALELCPAGGAAAAAVPGSSPPF
jgi:hypothetical protein